MIVISISQMYKLNILLSDLWDFTCRNPSSFQGLSQILRPSGNLFEVVAQPISFRLWPCGWMKSSHWLCGIGQGTPFPHLHNGDNSTFPLWLLGSLNEMVWVRPWRQVLAHNKNSKFAIIIFSITSDSFSPLNSLMAPITPSLTQYYSLHGQMWYFSYFISPQRSTVSWML